MDNIKFITSPHNPHFKRWMSLRETKGIKRHQQCLVCGEKIIRETLAHHPSICHEFLYSLKTTYRQDLPAHVKSYELPGELFRTIDIAGTSFPILVCQAKGLTSFNPSPPPIGIEVLCPLGDPMNLGTVIRSCSAFGVDKLILLEEATHPFHHKAIRASSGTVFNQHIVQGPSIHDLTHPEISQWIVSLDCKGECLTTWQWPQNIRLLVGEEGLGIPDGPFQKTLTIPQSLKADSLNAAIATSIALFTYRQQHALSRD